MKIAVAGTGYVGMSIATLLAQHNHVTAVDVIPEKVEKINKKISPIQDDYIEKYLTEKNLDLVRHSVENGCGKDAPGNLAHYMVEHTTMHAWPMSAGRFDIGSLDTYYEAVEKYGK